MNEQQNELELLRLRVEILEKQLEQQRQAEEAQRNPRPAPEVGMGRRVLNFMYNAGNAHAAMRNLLWALDDGVKVTGFIGGCAVAAVKITPAMVAKAKAAYAAALTPATANPVAVGVAAAVSAGVATERLTRCEDEDGKTKHHCAIM